MPPWLTWLVAVGVVSSESVLLGTLGVEWICLQTGIGVAAFLGAEREFTEGAMVLAALILPFEWLAGTPEGVYGLGLVAVYFAMQLVRNRLPRSWGATHVLAGTAAGALHPFVVWLSAALVAPSSDVNVAILWRSLPSLVGLALFLWAGGKLLERMDGFFERSTGSSRVHSKDSIFGS